MRDLNHHDIHEIYSQISQSLNCVECSAAILPQNIQITDMVDNECMFDVSCNRCAAEMTLSAHVEKNSNQAAMSYNKSSQIFHDSLVEEPVSSLDIRMVREELSNFCGSFIEAFSRY